MCRQCLLERQLIKEACHVIMDTYIEEYLSTDNSYVLSNVPDDSESETGKFSNSTAFRKGLLET